MSRRAWGAASALVVAGALSTACFSEHVTVEPVPVVSFANDVQPILTNNCATSGCHGQPVANPGAKPMVLVAGSAYAALVNVTAAQLPTMMRVRPGHPDSSYVIHKLQGTHRTFGGTGNQMPLNRAPLSLQTIDLIRRWIAAGALPN